MHSSFCEKIFVASTKHGLGLILCCNGRLAHRSKLTQNPRKSHTATREEQVHRSTRLHSPASPARGLRSAAVVRPGHRRRRARCIRRCRRRRGQGRIPRRLRRGTSGGRRGRSCGATSPRMPTGPAPTDAPSTTAGQRVTPRSPTSAAFLLLCSATSLECLCYLRSALA